MDARPPEAVELFEALYSTRAIRRFKPDPVPDELLFQVIDAAIRAPAGSNQQIWHFLIVRDPEKRRQIGEWYWQTWAEYGRQYLEDPSAIDRLPRQMRLVVRSTDDLARNFAEVPVHLFVCGPKTAAATVYPAIQNLLLACRGVGLGSGAHRLPSPPRREDRRPARHPRRPDRLRPAADRLVARFFWPGQPPAGLEGHQRRFLGPAVGLRQEPARGGSARQVDTLSPDDALCLRSCRAA